MITTTNNIIALNIFILKKRYNSYAVTCLVLLFFSQFAWSQTYNTVDWGTYFNDNAHYPSFNYTDYDAINQMVVDQNNPESIYIVGGTYAAPASSLSVCGGAQSIELNDGGNGYLAKYNRCGELIWSTYIGSTIFCVALDKENNKTIIYVGGKAYPGHAFSCDGSPVFQADVSDGSNGFIAKYIDDDSVPTLSRWTYLSGTSGGGATDAIHAIDINRHRIFTTGNTESDNLYVGAIHKGDTTYGGGTDGFVAEFDSLLSKLLFFTYIGDAGDDRCNDIKLSKSITKPLSFYVSGSTSSAAGIAKGSGFDQSFNGVNDAYMCKWTDRSNIGVFRQTWGTYIGGTENEHGRKSAIDNKGNIFLTGFGGSNDFPVTPLAYDTTYGKPGENNSQSDVFVVKLNSKGGLLWSTYFGGSSNEEVNGIALFKKQGIQYVAIAGVTVSPSTSFNLMNPLQTQLNGTDAGPFYDAFIAVFDDVSTQQHLIFSTYLGGSNDERAGVGQYRPSIAIGPHNIIYYGGVTNSSDINTVVGSEFQDLVSSYNGDVDGFVSKLIDGNDGSEFNCPAFAEFKSDHFTMENSGEGQITLYPNPTSGKLTIQINNVNNRNQQLTIYNLVGKMMFSKVAETKAGTNILHLDLSALTQGIYFIELNNGESSSRQMFVIEK
ncbi:MAG TPA: T9SS type A sorting domain-containing protein [Chitinophagales bacterium]|nr:T9SS type A sorting domain-containing protein [Chitinophagales bacterium]